MKNKIVMITALLAVMMAMVGIAIADIGSGILMDKYPNATIPDGGSIPITITWIGGGSQTLHWYLENIDGTAASEITGSDDEANSGADGIVSVDDEDNNFVLTVSDVSASVGDEFDLTVCGNYRSIENCKKVSMTTGLIIGIPEFPTVALPVAAVLGLVFFFQQRKNKKE
ncbi:MAG: PEF-CTERM sorting domain-containing protein [Euryarchaeota archaeon]|nr:PEF-CTERM sorting domain-containing protein [Euryarchaeota archaeon]MCG2737574.1 PEF-CTERM sorting domain-containing protein [Candidatus Methanoperedenaceae archaeon]